MCAYLTYSGHVKYGSSSGGTFTWVRPLCTFVEQSAIIGYYNRGHMAVVYACSWFDRSFASDWPSSISGQRFFCRLFKQAAHSPPLLLPTVFSSRCSLTVSGLSLQHKCAAYDRACDDSGMSRSTIQQRWGRQRSQSAGRCLACRLIWSWHGKTYEH